MYRCSDITNGGFENTFYYLRVYIVPDRGASRSPSAAGSGGIGHRDSGKFPRTVRHDCISLLRERQERLIELKYPSPDVRYDLEFVPIKGVEPRKLIEYNFLRIYTHVFRSFRRITHAGTRVECV